MKENDTIIAIDQAPNTNRNWLPIDIPSVLDNDQTAGALAKRFYDWTETVQVTDPETGAVSEVSNPISPKVAIGLKIRSEIKSKQITLAEEQGAEQGRNQARQQIEALFG